jgi:hypothetical protein
MSGLNVNFSKYSTIVIRGQVEHEMIVKHVLGCGVNSKKPPYYRVKFAKPLFF